MRIIMTISAIATLLLSTACNTVEGFGEDIGAAGGAIDKKAEESKQY